MKHLPLRTLLRRRPVLIGVPALVAACLLWFVLRTPSPSSFSLSRAAVGRPELHALVTAVGHRRTFEPRVTGDFSYGDLIVAPATRSGETATNEAPLDLRVAAVALEKRARESTDAVALNAFGIAQLVTGQTAAGVSTLEEATRLAPNDARLSSDLAAGYLVRSRQSNRIEDVARAVGYAQQATEADPRLAEARFNLALSLEGLSLRHEASKAWQSYLELDSDSPWAREVRQRLERLAETAEMRWESQRRTISAAAERGDEDSIRAVTQRLPDTVYEYVENDLIPAWADAWLERDVTKATTKARLARMFGQALADVVGDRMALDAALAIERASANRERADPLARGHKVFKEGRALYEQDRVAESTVRFGEARRALLDGQSPFAGWAILQLAIADYYRSPFEQSTPSLDALARDASEKSHLRLIGRVQWMKGLIYFARGQVSDSLDWYGKALTTLESARALADQSGIHVNIAANMEAVGDLNAAWIHMRQGLATLIGTRLQQRRQQVLSSAEQMARRAKLLNAAVFLETEAISEAQRASLPVAVVSGLLARAKAYHEGGQRVLANRDIENAGRWLDRISDGALATRLRAETMLAEGEILSATDPPRAVEILRDSLRHFRESRRELRVPQAMLALGRAQLAGGHQQSARASFREAIEALETQRATLPGGQLRLGYFDQPWNVFDEMIKLQADNPSTAPEALLYAERFRARDLAETGSDRSRASMVDPAALADWLPLDTTLVYYAYLDDRLLAWVVRSRRVDFIQQRVQSSVLYQEITSYRAAVEKGEGEEIDRAGFRLHDRLIRPLSPWLEAGATLTIIPDGVLNRVPFAALKNRETNRYLLEDHPVHVAPSATMFERASARLRRGAPAGAASLLVLANPRLDPSDAETLPDLSRAEDEARDLAALYPDAKVLTGARATKRAFLDAAARYRIVHFAGHAVANEQYSLLSRLLLSRDGPDHSGSLFAHEIQQLKLETTDLVVLAACRTGIGAIKKGEGVISLARPFLAVGVPSVIATLWDVNDEASRALFGTFYKSIRQGADPVVALRAAQLRLLRDPDATLRSPAAWGAFISLGGLRSNGGSDAH